MPDEIVVIGKYNHQDVFYDFFTYFRGSGGYTEPMPSDDPQDPDYDYAGSMTVSISCSAANRNGCIEAGKRLLEAVKRVRDKLVASSGTVTILGRNISMADLVADIDNTNYVVTDQTAFGNNGVGSAARGSGGAPNTDTINFQAIIGGGNPPFGYSVGYPNGEGMNAITLHELVHMSLTGTNFFNGNVTAYDAAVINNTVTGPFYGSRFGNNQEAFVNDALVAIGNLTGIAIDAGQGPIRPGGYANAVEPILL